MDRETYERERLREQGDLQQKLMAEAGTPEETRQWLARLEELDPEHFGDFEYEYQSHWAVMKRARELSAQMQKPLSRADLVGLVGSLAELQTASNMGEDIDIVDYEARYHLLHSANPDGDWEELIAQLEYGMTAEEVVEAALAFRPKRRVFAMPGPVDEEWVKEHSPMSTEGI